MHTPRCRAHVGISIFTSHLVLRDARTHHFLGLVFILLQVGIHLCDQTCNPDVSVRRSMDRASSETSHRPKLDSKRGILRSFVFCFQQWDGLFLPPHSCRLEDSAWSFRSSRNNGFLARTLKAYIFLAVRAGFSFIVNDRLGLALPMA